MRLTFTYDPSIDAWTVMSEGIELRTLEDLLRWKGLFAEGAKKLGGKKAYLLVDISGFTLDPALATEYGKAAREIRSRYALGLIRYGSHDKMTEASVYLQAILNRFPANIFPDREVALQALEKIRKLPAASVA